MKRTRQYVMIMATVAAFLCWTGPGGTAWGQAYKSGYVASKEKSGESHTHGIIDDSHWGSGLAKIYYLNSAA